MSTFENRLFNAIRLKRSPVRKRRYKSKRQRTAERDRLYVAWMHGHGCLVAGLNPDSPCSGIITVHHLRHITHEDGRVDRTGRIDRRTLTLCQGHHQTGPHAVHRMTADHGRAWEQFFGVNSEMEVQRYNALFDGPEPECECRFTGDRSDASGCPLHGVSRTPAVRLVAMEGPDACPF